MRGKTIINVSIGASALKVIYCEKKDTDVIVKDSVILETNSNLYLNKENLNINFIEDKLRLYLFNNKIKRGLICYSIPDYMMTTSVTTKQLLLNQEYVSSLIKGKIIDELIEEPLLDVASKVIDCQILNSVKLNVRDDTDGSTDLIVNYVDDSIVKSLKQMSKRLKMTPAVLEAESAGLLRMLDIFNVKDNYLIVDIGKVYTKIIFVCGTTAIDYQIIPTGVYKIDGLFASLYRCPPIVAANKRFSDGLIHNNSLDDTIFNVVNNVFSKPISDHLDNIFNSYNGLHFINKFLIAGGAWNIKYFKDVIQKQTLNKYGDSYNFESFAYLCKDVIFENEDVKENVMQNINSYASCLGLSLRGGL